MKLKDLKPLDLFKLKDKPEYTYLLFHSETDKNWYLKHKDLRFSYTSKIGVRKFRIDGERKDPHFYESRGKNYIYGYAYDLYYDLFTKTPGWNFRANEFTAIERLTLDSEVKIIDRFIREPRTKANSIAKTVLNF